MRTARERCFERRGARRDERRRPPRAARRPHAHTGSSTAAIVTAACCASRTASRVARETSGTRKRASGARFDDPRSRLEHQARHASRFRTSRLPGSSANTGVAVCASASRALRGACLAAAASCASGWPTYVTAMPAASYSGGSNGNSASMRSTACADRLQPLAPPCPYRRTHEMHGAHAAVASACRSRPRLKSGASTPTNSGTRAARSRRAMSRRMRNQLAADARRPRRSRAPRASPVGAHASQPAASIFGPGDAGESHVRPLPAHRMDQRRRQAHRPTPRRRRCRSMHRLAHDRRGRRSASDTATAVGAGTASGASSGAARLASASRAFVERQALAIERLVRAAHRGDVGAAEPAPAQAFVVRAGGFAG